MTDELLLFAPTAKCRRGNNGDRIETGCSSSSQRGHGEAGGGALSNLIGTYNPENMTMNLCGTYFMPKAWLIFIHVSVFPYAVTVQTIRR